MKVNGALNHELARCQFTEQTGSNDIGYAIGPSGNLYPLWWSDIPKRINFYTVPLHGGGAFTFRYTERILQRQWLAPLYLEPASRLMLVDEETDTVVAMVYNATTDCATYGTLKILVPFGDTYSLTALATFLSICEKLR